ncbi:hypothetical protein D9758_008259 [Tetrapyrgos nigripes]|uniref:RNA helicase n=1 Tax=Tetrapyrgos nigripes TaxID=182062 RepID=A0A8H5G1G7_9AGAR|nr:hypothetical protein D9758_008259 [Tetrapyrgos nigripes]
MSAPTCPQVLTHGTCSDPSCTYQHNVYSCEICSLVFRDEYALATHLGTRQHKRREQQGSGFFFCSLCNKYICGLGFFKQHIASKSHKVKAFKLGVSPTIAPEEPETVPGHQFCVVCNRHIAVGVWSRHCATPQHKGRENYASFQSALDEAEQDKNGITVSGEFDFGIIDGAIAASGKLLSGSIQVSVPTYRATLVGYTLASSKGQQTRSPFSVEIIGTNRTISQRTSIPFNVKVQQNHLGRFQDRLEMVFRDLQSQIGFLIARPLSVIVGNRSDHELLKPKSAYVPRKRTNRDPETEVIEGEIAPALNAIPYIDKLTWASIPKPLYDHLAAGSTKEVVDNLQKMYLPPVVNSSTYSKHFKHLMWAEEFQMERDLEYYDMHDIPLSRHSAFDAHLRQNTTYYYLKVPGLAEKRPSVLVGDRIVVQHTSATDKGRWYEGGVHVVLKEEVGLKFHRSFVASPSDRFRVRFKLNRIPMRRQHQAMDYTVFSQDRVLFPKRVHIENARAAGASRSRIVPKNMLIGKNQPQLQAVMSIVKSPPSSVPFIIYGPPGTGKTVTLVESILQVLSVSPTARVLACAPSNSAADLIAVRLQKHFNRQELFRAYAPSRNKNDVPSELGEHIYRNAAGHFSVPPLATMKRYRVIVTTCVSASIVSGIGMPRGHFSHIFIDEAGQATEPEVMIAIKGIADGRTNVVLSGDPKQLGPIIRSGVARALGLEKSLLERLMWSEGEQGVYEEDWGYGKSVVKLIKNFRSHPAILKFPNEQFYRGDLQACGDPKVINYYVGSSHLVDKNKKFPIVFHAISGKDDREASSPSFFNIDEVTVVKDIIRKLRDDRKFRTSDNDIAVIAPYHAQVLKLRTALRAVAESVKVGSVEEFQGQERRVIIISTVRSSREFVQYDLRHTLGFVANPRRFNVAVTRAQSLLFIVGDPSVLSLDPLWRSFLNYIHLNGGWTGPGPTWDTSEKVNEGGGYDSAVRKLALEDMNVFTRMMENMTLEEVKEDADADEDVDGNVDRPWNEVE